MPSPNERKALGFLVFLALSGASVRVWRARLPPPSAPNIAALERQLVRIDSAKSKPKIKTVKRPNKATKTTVTSPATIDVDRATAADLEALPGIGPALAARIVSHRDSAGSFGGMDALCEVKGVGAAMAARLEPLVTFSAPRRPVSATCHEGSKPSRNARVPRSRKSR